MKRFQLNEKMLRGIEKNSVATRIEPPKRTHHQSEVDVVLACNNVLRYLALAIVVSLLCAGC